MPEVLGEKKARSMILRLRRTEFERFEWHPLSRSSLLAVLASLTLSACVRQPETSHPQTMKSLRKTVGGEIAPNRPNIFPARSAQRAMPLPHWTQSGMASWYGARFANRRTSFGARFDPQKLTAAHRDLPMGTRVLVVDTRSGRSVTVTINDRGPFNSRVIDLSRAAAKRLGMLHRGVAHVRIAVVAPSGDSAQTNMEVAQARE